ncbi:hypothetical protein ScPMuIL_015207 [Solemya velum]
MEKFVWSVQNGDLDKVKELVEQQNMNVNEQIQGRCPLHCAADYGQAEVIEYLVSRGADVNAEDKHGITPLLAAVFEGHTDCVRILLAKGAKKNGKAPDGSSYIDCAEKEDIKNLLK